MRTEQSKSLSQPFLYVLCLRDKNRVRSANGERAKGVNYYAIHDHNIYYLFFNVFFSISTVDYG